MSHPFNAQTQPPDVMFDPPLQRKQGKHFYSVAYMVWGIDPDSEKLECDWILGVLSLDADTLEEAESKVMNWVKWVFKECHGYVRHKIKGERINEVRLANAGYFRR